MPDPALTPAVPPAHPLGPASPTVPIPGDPQRGGPQPGVALCLSGGGYRAMVFHIGALWRLNQGGLLRKLDRISSVSGGSITAGVLGLNWSRLDFDAQGVARNFDGAVVAPLRHLAGKTIDAGAIFGGVLLPGSVGDKVGNAYRKHLFGDATLQRLPDHPRFVINATSVQSGALWRFSKPFMADYRVGLVRNPEVPLATAVAASSAFPPVLSPVELDLEDFTFEPGSGMDLQHEPYTSTAVLTDGGVYDNLGLETAWKRYKTVLVSDGGGRMNAEPDPERDWGRHAVRVLGVIDNQVRSLRKRQLMEAFKDPAEPHGGAYWGIHTDLADYGLADALPCPVEATRVLADTPTRLKRMEPELQDRLINWGYAVCDAALRRYAPAEVGGGAGGGRGVIPAFPYRGAGV